MKRSKRKKVTPYVRNLDFAALAPSLWIIFIGLKTQKGNQNRSFFTFAALRVYLDYITVDKDLFGNNNQNTKTRKTTFSFKRQKDIINDNDSNMTLN